MAVGISNWQAMSVADQKTMVKRSFFRNKNEIVQRVEKIISEARTKGDIALQHLTPEFDAGLEGLDAHTVVVECRLAFLGREK